MEPVLRLDWELGENPKLCRSGRARRIFSQVFSALFVHDLRSYFWRAKSEDRPSRIPVQGTIMIPETTALKQLGVTPTNEQIRLSKLSPEEARQELAKNLEAYTNEVLADKPVSVPYHYWFDAENNIYSNPSLKPIYRVNQQFDPQERGGIPRQGFEEVTNLLFRNPGRLVFWYSPQGPASFDDNPENPFSQITYDYGQLYIQYYDGGQVKAVAVKVGEENNLHHLVPELFDTDIHLENMSQEERISFFLLRPVLSHSTIDGFLERDFENVSIYTDKDGKNYFLHDVIHDIRHAFSHEGNRTTVSRDDAAPQTQEYEMTKEYILNVYVSAIKSYMERTGKTEMQLSGSCGGGQVTSKTIEEWLKNNETLPQAHELLSAYSSQFRVLTQQEKKKWEYHDGTCCLCHRDTKVGPCSICADCAKTFDKSS